MIPRSSSGAEWGKAIVAHAAFFHGRGWVAGTAGNLSVRPPEGPILITPSGRHKGTLSVGDLVPVSPDGGPLFAGNGRPSAETAFHAAIYRYVPKAGAVYHVHTVESNLVSLWGGDGGLSLPPLEMLKGLGVPAEETSSRITIFPNMPEVHRIAAEVEKRFREGSFEVPGFLIRLHGLTVWGEDPDQALHHVELMDFLFRYLVLERQTMNRGRVPEVSAASGRPSVTPPTRGRRGGKKGGEA